MAGDFGEIDALLRRGAEAKIALANSREKFAEEMRMLDAEISASGALRAELERRAAELEKRLAKSAENDAAAAEKIARDEKSFAGISRILDALYERLSERLAASGAAVAALSKEEFRRNPRMKIQGIRLALRARRGGGPIVFRRGGRRQNGDFLPDFGFREKERGRLAENGRRRGGRKMRRIFAAAAACACACAFAADLKTSAYESARAAEGELAEFGRMRAEKISEKKAELDALSAQIRACACAKRLCAPPSRSARRSRRHRHFCDSRARELAADIGEFSASFFPDSAAFAPRSSAAECLQKLESDSDAWLKKLFNPLVPAPFSAKPAKSREKVAGGAFRVGAFGYFVSPARAGFLDSSGVLYGEKFAPEIRAFFAGESNVLPADVSGGELLAAEKNSRGIAEEISLGGVWMYPILFLGFLSAVVFA